MTEQNLHMDAYWMPFTANRKFREHPRMIVGADGMYYTTADGQQILDGTAGLWCVNAGHGRKKILEAVQDQMARLDYASSFQMGHPGAFRVTEQLAEILPGDLNYIFLTNSGSESVDTALKIALAYHYACGQSSRHRLIGRERGYHGVGFGGISVGGLVNNRRAFGPMLPGADHLRHTLDLEHNAFSRGVPEWGANLADELETKVALHGAETIAAVIVEPVAGAGGVLPPPVGYLQRLREICDKYGILLIFDEVITGFGRLGAAFASDFFGVLPDIVTMAKGLTSGTIPMGAVAVREGIYDAFMHGPEDMVELFHGYTYSGHPVACAAASATLEIYQEENLFERAAEMAPYWEEAVQSLRGKPHVIDIRNLGLLAAIELEPRAGHPLARAAEVAQQCYDNGLLVRPMGDTLAMSPPLIIEKEQIEQSVEKIADALEGLD